MGDRSNIVVETSYGSQGNSRVYLYSHWSGQNIIESAIEGLRSPRVNDSSYLTRIIFEHMIHGALDPYTGFGISARLHDNEHELFVIYVRSGGTVVYFENEDGEELTRQIPVAEFLKIVDSIEKLSDDAYAGSLYSNLIERMK